MTTVKAIIAKLQKLPQELPVVAYNEDAVVYTAINDLQVENGRVVLYDEIPENFRVKKTNLCPDCKVYCEKRFIDGRCE